MFAASAPLAFSTIPRPAFGRAAQHQPAHATPAKVKAEARYQRAARTAAELLPELPGPGTSIHALMLGTFDLCQVIVAVIPRLPTVRHLRIATLCFSKRNAVELLGLLETYPAMRLTVLVSDFFKNHNKALYEAFAEDLQEHPTARIAAARSHCKVTLFDIAEDDAIVFEGSANLRTNKNREQLCVIRDRPLHDWHSNWLDDMVRAHDAEEEKD